MKNLYYDQNKPSFDHRASRVRRIIRWILNDDKWDFKNIKIHEKQKKKKNLIDINDLNLIFSYLSRENDKAIYLICFFTFILGLSLRLISKIKKKNISFNTGTLSIYQNRNRIRRNLSISFVSYLKDYLDSNNISENDFLFYNDFKEKKNSISRENYIKTIISNIIGKISFANNNRKFIILKLMNCNRHPLNSIDYICGNNDFFGKKLINKECDLNNINISIINKNDGEKINKSNDIFKKFDLINNSEIDFNSSLLFNNDSFSKNESLLFGFEEYNSKSYKKLKTNLEYNNCFSFDFNSDKELLSLNNKKDTIKNKFNFSYSPYSFSDITDYTSALIKNILKTLNIEFIDFAECNNNNFKSTKEITDLNNYKLNDFNLYIYNQMKINTALGFYMGLKLKKTGKTGYSIHAVCKIEENTLLFEVGGEIISQEFLDKNKELISKRKHCYINFFDEKKTKNSKVILLMNKANITLFIKKSDSKESNVIFSPYIKENNQFGLLCISAKKIKTNEIIRSNKISII